jgi:hypothetical protein
MSPQTIRRPFALLSLAIALAACGGGGGGGTSTPAPGAATPPPPAAAVGPAITTQPVSQSVVAGQAATFSVAADSTVTGCQWQRDGKDIPGANGLTYTLANPQAADNGAKFTAVATGTRGSTVSAAAVLTVSVPKGLALVAGNPGGFGNLDGTDARLALPGLLAMQPSGALYLVDSTDTFFFEPSVRTINLATGAVTTLERDPALRGAGAIAVDAAGNLYDAPWATGPATAIYRTPPGGKRALFAGADGAAGSTDGAAGAARFTQVSNLAVDAAGNLYVNDGGKRVRKVTPGGTVTTLAGGGAGDMVDGTGAQAAFQQIGAIAADAAGNLTLIDNRGLRAVSAAGVVTTRKLAVADGSTLYMNPWNLTVDGSGNSYVLENVYPPRVRKIAPDGTVTTAGTLPASGSSGTRYTNLVADAHGNVYVGDDASQTIRRVVAGTVVPFAGRAAAQANVDGTGTAAQFSLDGLLAPDPHWELATDAQGNVYVGEGALVRKVTPAGVVTTLNLPLGGWTRVYYPSSVAVDGSVLVASNGVISRIDAAGVSHFIAGQAGVAGVADGVGAKATFSSPSRLFEDVRGNIWLTDTVAGSITDPYKTYYRKIAPDGTVTTLADNTRASSVTSLYRGKDDTRWVLEGDMQTIVRIDPNGTRTTVRQAHDLNDRVTALTVDRNGNLYVVLSVGNDLNAVSKITPDGSETVIAGKPGAVGVRAGTPGSLGHIDAITVAPDGTVYVMSEGALVRILQ